MFRFRAICVIACLVALVSALVIPNNYELRPAPLPNLQPSALSFDRSLHSSNNRNAINAHKRNPSDNPEAQVPPPSNLIRAGANEDDREVTEFFSVTDENRRVATWRWISPRYVYHDDIDGLRAWLNNEPDAWTDISDNEPHVWRHGGAQIEVRAYYPRPLILTRRVLAFWVAFLGTHRRGTHANRPDMAPAGMLDFEDLDAEVTITPVDPDEDDETSPDSESSDDSWDGLASEDDGDVSEVDRQLINNANQSRTVFDPNSFEPENGTPPPPYTEYHPWWEIGQFGGPSPYLQKRFTRRTFTLKQLWDRLFGHRNDSGSKDDKPYLSMCGCRPKRMVVDLDSELHRLQLDHLDLTTYTTDDPTDHERISQYLTHLQGLPTTASNGDKAYAIASLIQLSDSPSAAMVESLEAEMCGCASKNSSTITNAKRDEPAGLALSNFEDDRWNNQLSRNDVDLLRHDLMHNGLTRVDPNWQSFNYRNAYVSWSKKFGDDEQGVAAPSWEEIFEYVDAFHDRVNWGNEDWWREYEPIGWSTSYRDILFGQRRMRLCISNRPSRCLD